MSAETLSMVIDGGGPKGDVMTVAELAGVMGGKRTSELIPLCHPLPLTDLVVQVTPDRVAGLLRVRAEAATTAQTGVEMEALTAASVAALTIYDMVKGLRRASRFARSGWSRRPAARAANGPAAPATPAPSASDLDTAPIRAEAGAGRPGGSPRRGSGRAPDRCRGTGPPR